MTKLTNYTYQGRRVIGPFGPEDKPTRVGWYPASFSPLNAHNFLVAATGGSGVHDWGYYWKDGVWRLSPWSGRVKRQDKYWYALEEPKEAGE